MLAEILDSVFPDALHILSSVSYGGISRSIRSACLVEETYEPRDQADVVLQPYEEIIEPTFEVIKSDKFHGGLEDTYSMRSKQRGVFFLVNNIHFGDESDTRQGAHVDRDDLITLFRGMGFIVFYYEDLKREVIIYCIWNLGFFFIHFFLSNSSNWPTNWSIHAT